MGPCCCKQDNSLGVHTRIDDIVRIRNISDTSLIGKTGVVIRWLHNSETTQNDGGRWLIALTESDRRIALKPPSLEVIGRVVQAEAIPFSTATASCNNSSPDTPINVSPIVFQISDIVELNGLRRIDLNNKQGVLMNWIPNVQTSKGDGGRWNVQLQNEKRYVAVKPENLRLLHRNQNKMRPLISSVAEDPERTEPTPSAGLDAALGNAFNTSGMPNNDSGPAVATAIG